MDTHVIGDSYRPAEPPNYELGYRPAEPSNYELSYRPRFFLVIYQFVVCGSRSQVEDHGERTARQCAYPTYPPSYSPPLESIAGV